MIAYVNLRKRIADYLSKQFVFDPDKLPPDECFPEAEFIIAEVFRTLEMVTPEMKENAALTKTNQLLATALWGVMLRASPLVPSDDKP